ncbi:hypothetical protein PT2222_240108 [Paraburkholderia tropica]
MIRCNTANLFHHQKAVETGGVASAVVMKAAARGAGASLNRKLARAHPVDIRNAARSHQDGAAREAS